jgi:glycosyltransferase involved in cell wall biosynthesis
MIGIYCHHTSVFSHNTGIQRCVRATATALHHQHELIVPLVWNHTKNCFCLANQKALEHLSLWGGPPLDSWCLQFPPRGSWIVVIELISGPNQPSQSQLIASADENGWKSLAVFHDDIPLSWAGVSAKFHSKYMLGLANYNVVLATSSFTRIALEKFWVENGLLAIKTKLSALTLAAEIPAVPRKYSQPINSSEPLRLLFVGSLEPRKNHASLFKAMAWLQAHSELFFELVLVGWQNDVEVLAKLKRAQLIGLPIVYEGEVSDQYLVELYANSNFSIYPSLLEGFGLPVMESCWLGTPCIASAVPALLDQKGVTGCFVLDKVDWFSIASALLALQKQQDMLDKLNENVNKMELKTWSEYASALLLNIQKYNTP